LQDLKEKGTIEVKWIAIDDNSMELFTKNLQGPLLKKHSRTYCRNDEYMRGESKRQDDTPKGRVSQVAKPGHGWSAIWHLGNADLPIAAYE
jgi:hypothetical protein